MAIQIISLLFKLDILFAILQPYRIGWQTAILHSVLLSLFWDGVIPYLSFLHTPFSLLFYQYLYGELRSFQAVVHSDENLVCCSFSFDSCGFVFLLLAWLILTVEVSLDSWGGPPSFLGLLSSKPTSFSNFLSAQCVLVVFGCCYLLPM